LRGEIPLVEGSQRLAQDLYSILEGDRRITSGDLAVCLFQAENYPYTHFLGIMKVDPVQIFRHVVLQDKRGNQYVSFETLPQAFTSERLQKCAFIQPLEPRHPEFDMLLLDRQQRLSENGSVARFFSETFLDAEEAFDARKMTEIVYRGLISAETASARPDRRRKRDVGRRRHAGGNLPPAQPGYLAGKPALAAEIKQEIDRAVSPRLPTRRCLSTAATASV
jgi:hypothetical protein